jgi:iron complex transport system ATP-binding protein
MRLEVDGIHFSYNSHPVLAGVHFSLGHGQVMCILGVNGAGKSTLIKCLNRILAPQKGTVLLEGEALERLSQVQVARRMGYVPQRHGQARLTVFETVLMGRKPHMGWKTGPEDYALVERIIGQMGLEPLALRCVEDLSGGELQKVVIARALAQAPKILLLDEPTSSLDLRNQLEVMGLIRRIVKDQGLSAIIAIHDLNTAVRFADSFLFLKDHRIHAASTRETLSGEVIRQVYGVKVVLKHFEGHTVVVPTNFKDS